MRAKINAGWCQNNFAEKHTPDEIYNVMPDDPEATHYCLVGALRASSRSFNEFLQIRDLLIATAQPKGKKKITSLGQFNDTEGMTKQRVLNLLDRALAHASV